MKKGAAIYTDGGARPTPGNAGIGVHGFTFVPKKPKKGAGVVGHVLTMDGYVVKTNFVDDPKYLEENYTSDNENWDWDNIVKNHATASIQVTPVEYIDISSDFSEDLSNNGAEILAMAIGLEQLREMGDIGYINVYTDSKYTLTGITAWINTWIKNNWIGSSGKPVANQEHWLRLKSVYDGLQESGVVVKLGWNKGHSGILGNELADTAATIGVLKSMRRRLNGELATGVVATVLPADGYWKDNNKRHPFLNQASLIFNTDSRYHIPGQYATCTMTKDFHELGKRDGDVGYAFVKLNEPEKDVENTVRIQTELCGAEDEIYTLLLARLYSPSVHRVLEKWGDDSLVKPKEWLNDVYSVNDTKASPVTHHLYPPKLALRAVDAINYMVEILESVLNPTAPLHNVVTNEVTNTFYETVTTIKGKKTTTATQLRARYTVGYKKQDIEVEYPILESKRKAKVTLTFGLDIPDRNALKRIETLDPKVHVVTWSDDPCTFKYATVIVTKDGEVGIWCGYYSNARFTTASD